MKTIYRLTNLNQSNSKSKNNSKNKNKSKAKNQKMTPALLTSKIYDLALVGITLSAGQYYDKYDHTYWEDDIPSVNENYIKQFKTGGESAVVVMGNDPDDPTHGYCMVSFRGREIDEPTDWEWFWKDHTAFNPMEDALKAIKDSPISTVVSDGDEEWCLMNDELMSKFSVFEDVGDGASLKDEIMDCLDMCDWASNVLPGSDGTQCDLYFAGHSNGGVYAYAQAITMLTDLRAHYGQPSYDPTIFTFGVPPAFSESTGCNALQHENIYNFINVHEIVDTVSVYYYGKGDPRMDIAVGINIGNGATHIGQNIITTEQDPNNVKVFENPNDMTYEATDYDLRWNTDDLTRLYAHKASGYQTNLKNYASMDNQIPAEDGFSNGSPCRYAEQCASNKSGGEPRRCKA